MRVSEQAPMLFPADPLREGALTIVRTLRAAGFQALFAGGCVRDRVLGLVPKDYDVATDAEPTQVVELFARSIPVGMQFGVVRVLVEHHQYEVATFRAEANYADGRRPVEIRWADAREDVLRRDFTVNGLLEDPLAPGGGEVLDFVGGLADLQARVIRAIGDARARFLEDYLRLIRGVRFAARMAFEIDPATWEATRELAANITRISGERIGEELGRIVTQGHQARGLALLAESRLLAHILPELAPAERLARAIARLRHIGACEPVLGWGTTLLDAPDAIERVAARLRWSRALTRSVAEAIEVTQDVARWPEISAATRKRAARRATFGVGLVIAGTAGHRREEALARAEAEGWSQEELRPRPLLTGDDLKRAGHAPGPAFKDALEALETAQLEGRAKDLGGAWEIVTPFLMPQR